MRFKSLWGTVDGSVAGSRLPGGCYVEDRVPGGVGLEFEVGVSWLVSWLVRGVGPEPLGIVAYANSGNIMSWISLFKDQRIRGPLIAAAPFPAREPFKILLSLNGGYPMDTLWFRDGYPME